MKKDCNYGNSESAFKHLIKSVDSEYSSKRRKLKKGNKKNAKIKSKKNKKGRIIQMQNQRTYMRNKQKEALKYAEEIFFKYYEQLIDNSLKSFSDYIKSYNDSRKVSLLNKHEYRFKIEDTVSNGDIILSIVFREQFAKCMKAIMQYVLNKNMNYNFIVKEIFIGCNRIEEKRVLISAWIRFEMIGVKDKVRKKCDKSIYKIARLYYKKYKDKEEKNKKIFDSLFEEYNKLKEEEKNFLNKKATDLALVIFNKYHKKLIDKVLDEFIETLEKLMDLPFYSCIKIEINTLKELNEFMQADIYSDHLRDKYFNIIKEELICLAKKELSNKLPFKFCVTLKSDQHYYYGYYPLYLTCNINYRWK